MRRRDDATCFDQSRVGRPAVATRSRARDEWADRYGRRADDYRLPNEEKAREAYAEQVGEDGWALRSAVYSPSSSKWLDQIAAVETLRRVWVQQFFHDDGKTRWRHSSDTPPSSLMISSPYDTEAHYARKRSTSWIGYEVQLTETCEDEGPHLITYVETTDAPAGDADAIPPIHEALAGKGLLPSRHLVDTGYVEAKLLVSEPSTHGVDLYGPTRSDYHWQSHAGLGFAAGQFAIDWEKQEAACPEGKTSLSWTPAIDRGDNEVMKIKFSRKDCGPCPSRALCTTSKRHGRRTITIRAWEAYEALAAARARQKTQEFKTEYGTRAGVERTISQGVRAFGLRRGRYFRFAKTQLQHLLTGTAINLARLDDWIASVARETTRLSPFQQLMKALASG